MVSYYNLKLPTHAATAPTATTIIAAHLRSRLTTRSSLAVFLHAAILALAGVGLVAIAATTMGRLSIIPSHSAEVIRNAGWSRPSLFPSPPLPQPHRTNTSSRGIDKLSYHNLTPSSSPDDEAIPSSSLHLLILTPLSSSSHALPSYFSLLDALVHPRLNTSLGFLVSDARDGTESLLMDLVRERAGEYRGVGVVRKDFGLDAPVGEARHKAWLQGQRRSVLAKARSTLLMSSLTPSVDWVLWLDSDVVQLSPTLFEDLLVYGKTGGEEERNDVVAANVFTRNEVGRLEIYDQNNWAETEKSRAMKSKLPANKLLVEGSPFLKTHRSHLVDLYQRPNITNSHLPTSFPELREAGWSNDSLYDPSSLSHVGRVVNLDAVGGVATLVRAETHRLGAVFPAYLLDHQLETEGFGVMAKLLGARVVGLPNYFVVHASPN